MPTYRVGFAHPLEELRDEFDHLWESLSTNPSLHGWGPSLHGWGLRQRAGVFPAVNVSESDESITVETELPGLEAGDIDISMVGDELVLKGSLPDTATAAQPGNGSAGNGEQKQAVTWHRRERGTGGFERRVLLPTAVDPQRVDARLVDGVLTVTCPKAPKCQPHKVEVRSS